MTTFASMPRLFFLLLATISVFVNAAGVVAPQHAGRYLYAVEQESAEPVDTNQLTIIDYVAPLDRPEMNVDGLDSVDESRNDERPAFLYAENYPHHRVVTFYLHWCYACRQFQPRFQQMAQRVRELVPNHKVEFLSVSCSANHAICSEQELRAFPSVLMIRPNETGMDGRLLVREKISTVAVLEKLGLKDEVSTSSGMRKAFSLEEQASLDANDTVKAAFVPKNKRRQPSNVISMASAFLLPLSVFLVFLSGSLLGGGKSAKLVVKAG